MTEWVDVAPEAELARRKRIVIEHDGVPILVLWHEGRPYALANLCIHRDRELAKGVVLRGKLVCPGHQWAFELGTGWEAVKQECQPVYDVRVADGIVAVDVSSRRTVSAPAQPAES